MRSSSFPNSSRLLPILIALAVGAMQGCTAPTPTTPETAPRIAPEPSTRLVVTIDSHGSVYAINGATDVSFDMSESSGVGLRYDLDFGDGSHASAPKVNHVYALSKIGPQTVRATVTDAFGRTDTTTQTVQVISINNSFGDTYWRAETVGHNILKILTQDGRNVAGTYWVYGYLSRTLTTTSFTGTLTSGNDIHLVLSDGTRLDGPLILIDTGPGYSAYARHMLLTVRGGPDNGSTLDFTLYDNY